MIIPYHPIGASHKYFKFLNVKFVARFDQFQFPNFLLLGTCGKSFFSSKGTRFPEKNSKRKRITSYKPHESPTKSLCKHLRKFEFDMSTSASSDGVTSSSAHDNQGTSKRCQFWISKVETDTEPVCPLTCSGLNEKRSLNNILRQFIIVNNIKDIPTMNSERPVTLKILNYNVLSQGLLQRHRYLYRMQQDYMLRWNYRKQRIEQDIISYSPDVFCIQEVEEEELPYFYKHLETLGYRAIYKMKTRNKGDGLAIFYRHPGVILLEQHAIEFSQPGVFELESRDQVGLIGKFKKNGKEFIVANTHLLYNPRRIEVRMAQIQIFLAELHRITRNQEKDRSKILLMGDFNSSPETPLIQFILEGKLESSLKPLPPILGISSDSVHVEDGVNKLHHSERENQTENPPSEEQKKMYSIRPDGVSHKISHPFNFSSVYELCDIAKRGVTTYQNGWVMVDYIFYTEQGLKLLRRLSLPTPSDCDHCVEYLPNNYFPSDHLPLLAEFQIL